MSSCVCILVYAEVCESWLGVLAPAESGAIRPGLSGTKVTDKSRLKEQLHIQRDPTHHLLQTKNPLRTFFTLTRGNFGFPFGAEKCGEKPKSRS